MFAWPYDRHQTGWPTLTERLKKILRRAGLPATRLDLFHRIRRTTATYTFNELGLDATQAQLGHSDPRITRGYLDKRKIERKHAAHVLPRPQLD